MIRRQAYVFQLRADETIARKLRQMAGCARFVRNRALAMQQARHSAGERLLGYSDLCKQLTEWRSDPATPWLAEAQAQVLQQALKDLWCAYANFFSGRAGHPRFHKKGRHESFRYQQAARLDQPNARVYLPKIGWVRYRSSRHVEGAVKNITVACSAGRWNIAIQTEREVDTPTHRSRSAIGIDLGVARFATLSDGTVITPHYAMKRRAAALTRAHRALSRKIKYSRNWKKSKAKVGRIYQRIAATRRDHLHKASTAISQNHALAVIEDLRVRSMSASARGTSAAHGRNVRAKSGLNRAILDQGWSEFRRQLEYKQAWHGGMVLAVPAAYTSQKCLACGHIHQDNRKSQEHFCCIECGYSEHADLVAARNILAAGHAVMACGGAARSGSPTKQEPTEATSHECHA